jgi:hypothetical protein
MKSQLTTPQREEAEALSFTLFGRTSTWKTWVKKGTVRPVLDEQGQQVLHKGIKVSRPFYPTELEVLDDLRDKNTKFLAFKKKKAEEQEKKRLEKEALEKATSAAGEVGQ